ncbi:MAG: UDP-N-acetylmuramate--L-alanine ligase [Hydrogenibacillus sp.]|nr:UDP-N-acetylmuramate--L-alanine ligase [Hydrogenibacillus sp.]
MEPIRKLHFIGIGGYGMSALARIFLARGAAVSGSDLKHKPITEALAREGAQVWIGHNVANVPSDAVVVYSSDVPADNVELAVARSRGQVVMHRAELLARLVNDARGVAVAGSHGKTTTTGMIGCALTAAGWDPTVVIGGELVAGGTNARAGRSPYVIAEADESDRSFLRYRPYVSVITNIEPDHLENYGGDFQAMRDAFRIFAEQTKPGGAVVVGVDDDEARTLAEALFKPPDDLDVAPPRLITFAVDRPADVTARDIEIKDGRAAFTLVLHGDVAGRVELQVIGRHHVYNALASAGALSALGLTAPQIVAGLGRFRGTKRRFEFLGEADGALVVDDYAVHPTEIRATLAAARALGRRVIAVFQPHRMARVYYLREAFAEAFGDADLVFVGAVYTPRGDRAPEAVDAAALAQEIARRSGRRTTYIEDQTALYDALLHTVQPGDLVITLGAGDIRAIGEALVQRRQGQPRAEN